MGWRSVVGWTGLGRARPGPGGDPPDLPDLNDLARHIPLDNARFQVPIPAVELEPLVGRRRRKIAKFLTGPPRGQRTQELVAGVYEESYAASVEDYIRQRRERRDVFLVEGRPVYVDGWYIVKSYADVYRQVLARLPVESVLDVGSGRGLHLGLLALARPDLSLTGVELTAGGVAFIRRLVHERPDELARVWGGGAWTDQMGAALGGIRLVQGSALAMPFRDQSVDMSFTCLVLEQLAGRYGEALREMRRVTRKYCAFIEPFAEANSPEGLRYLTRLDYFRYSYRTLAEYGLEPICVSVALPQKLRFCAALVVARVR